MAVYIPLKWNAVGKTWLYASIGGGVEFKKKKNRQSVIVYPARVRVVRLVIWRYFYWARAVYRAYIIIFSLALKNASCVPVQKHDGRRRRRRSTCFARNDYHYLMFLLPVFCVNYYFFFFSPVPLNFDRNVNSIIYTKFRWDRRDNVVRFRMIGNGRIDGAHDISVGGVAKMRECSLTNEWSRYK